MHIMRGIEIMNYLKIENGKGYFLGEDGEYKLIDSIRKEDILRLLENVVSADVVFKMDEMSKENIQNQAHRIIYSNIYEKFLELQSNKNCFWDECKDLYREALNKYKSDA